MLANAQSLVSLINDKSYDRTVSGKLYVLQDEKWRQTFAVLKANLLFFFDSETQQQVPVFLLIMEDCTIELTDDNVTGRPFSFSIRFKTTRRNFQIASESFKSMESWISHLTVSSVDYMSATRQMLQEAIAAKVESNAVEEAIAENS